MTHSPLHVPPARPTVPPPGRPRSLSLAWLLGGVALTALAIVPPGQLPHLAATGALQPAQSRSTQTAQTCQAVLNADQRLSRDQLTQFIALGQGTPQAAVHETIAPPYCTLSKSHQAKQREAYPLAFDPDTWFVVNYEQGDYRGYDFVFRR
ncbi:MAG: hypothetical protein AAF808_04595 [Cyanobacteria bacterium P01_D01_bin.2]